MSLLLQPLEAGRITLKNRLILPPMATGKASPSGAMSEELIDYYREKSTGGYLSLVIIEHSFVTPQGRASARQLSSAEDAMIPGLASLAETIHHNLSKAVMQLSHAGSATTEEVAGCTPVGPSAVPNPRKGNTPRALSTEEIACIPAQFAQAARRAKAAGFDGVEIHSAHGYLLNQFFSPLTNKRTDDYGGDVMNRIRLHLEIIRAVREAVSSNFPILLRLGAGDYMDGGSTIEDSQIAATAFEKAGVDVIDVSGGFCGYTIPGNNEQGYFAPLSEAIKNKVSIPVILTGGITDAAFAEKLLTEGKADLIGVGRAIFNDSGWAKRAVGSLQ